MDIKDPKQVCPMYDRVLIRPEVEPEESQSKGGLILLKPRDGETEKPMVGTIIALGEGYLNTDNGVIVPLTVHVEQLVIFGRYSGTEIEIEGAKYVIVRERDILAVLEEGGS